MINTESTMLQKYSTPVCEVVENVPDEVLCDSSNGTTEGFGDLGNYNW